MTRLLRAGAAGTVLVLLLGGPPVLLLAGIGNPSTAWPALLAGDLSDTVLLHLAACLLWVVWACFLWSVLQEILNLARDLPRARPPGSLPGFQQLAHTLVIAAFVILPAAMSATNPTPRTTAAFTPGRLAVTATTHPDDPTISPAAYTATHASTTTTALQQAPRNQAPGNAVDDLTAARLGTSAATGHLPTVVAAHALSPAPVFAAGAGAGLLAGLSLRELQIRRRRQWRHRRPGRVIPATPTDLSDMSKALLRRGTPALQDVDWLDQSLRLLAHQLSTHTLPLPDVAAVRLSTDVLELVIPGLPPNHPHPHRPPPPWQAQESTGNWWLLRGEHAPADALHRRWYRQQFAPYPALVSIGSTDEGEQWLLDLEHTGTLTLTGDQTQVEDLARFISAELANSTWSEQLHVTLTLPGEDITPINPDRLAHTNDPNEQLAALAAHLNRNQAALHDFALTDCLHGRVRDIAADTWMPRILILHASSLTPASRSLLKQLHPRARRAGIALIVLDPDNPGPAGSQPAHPYPTGPGQDSDHARLLIDSDGYAHLPQIGAGVRAHQLSANDAQDLAKLLSAHTHLSDQPAPAARGIAPWDPFMDVTGAPRSYYTTARPTHDEPPPTSTSSNAAGAVNIGPPPLRLLHPAHRPPRHEPPSLGTRHVPSRENPSQTHEPADRQPDSQAMTGDGPLLGSPLTHLLAAAATTEADMHTLAPSISPAISDLIHQADPDLDADLAHWHDPRPGRARLSVLGPLQVRANGPLPGSDSRTAWHIEVVAYLAAHDRGVTSAQLGAALWPEDPDIDTKSKVRNEVYLTRRWLGTDPTTGKEHIPAATAKTASGASLYRVENLLIDADLFRRLRLRALATGRHGITDLETALALVTGPPFDQRRPQGYSWLVDEVPLDVEYTSMIIDVAHLVATHHLSTGHPELAERAARVALTAGSFDDIPLLDLVAACDAQGMRAQAAAWIQRILTNNDAEVEEDLPPRTADILFRRERATRTG